MPTWTGLSFRTFLFSNFIMHIFSFVRARFVTLMSSRPPGYPSPETVSVSRVCSSTSGLSARASRMRVVELAWQTETCATCAVGFSAGASHLAPGSKGCIGGISLACWTRAIYPTVWRPQVDSSGRRDTEPSGGQSRWIRPLLGSRSGFGNYRPSSPPLMQCAGTLTVWWRPCGGSRRAVGAHRHQHPGSRSSRRASLQLRSAVIEETSPVPDERVRRGLPGVGADGPAVRQVFNRIHCCWVDLPSDDLHRVVRVEGSIRESVTL